MSIQTLTAFYDFEVSPITFDFAVFAILAEMERRRCGAHTIHFVFVPGANDRYRSDDIEYDSHNKDWRLRNIILPICSMMPCRTETTSCLTREHAKKIEANPDFAPFPQGYRVDAPIGQFGWSSLTAAVARGESLPTFKGSPQASDYMKRWLAEHTDNRKAVCITLRESTHYAARNSNVEAWLAFARNLDPTVYIPIILRDTERCFEVPGPEFDGLTLCSIAAVNLELRMALYEHSWLTMMVLNGPGELCRLSDSIRYIFFDMLTEEVPSTAKIYATAQGIKIGGNLPHATPYQWQIWEPDELDILTREFARMEAAIGDKDTPNSEAADTTNVEDPMEVAVRLQMTGRLEDATTIYQKIVQAEPDNADAWHMLGIIAHQAGKTDVAEKLVLRAITLKSDQANYFVTFSHILEDLERQEEAVNALKNAVGLANDDASAHGDLAEALNRAGDRPQAESTMMAALKLAPDSIDLLERAAVLLQEWENIEEAAQFFRRAHDIRKEIERKQFEGDQKMSEVPRVTLTTG
jgi:tetratricopeptide (TPR) repeat protein